MPLGARMLWAGALLAASLGAQVPPSSDPDPPRPLTARGLDNLSALARLFGFVRYFYPSDEAAATDWSRVAVEAVRAVEPASSPTDLAARLQSVFAPMAPQVRVLPAGAPRPLMEMQAGQFVLLYQYRGLGPPQGRANAGFFSTRFLVPSSQAPLVSFAPFRADLPGAVSCMVPMALYRGPGTVTQPPPLPPPPGSPNDRAVRLAAAIVAWNVFQHFYPTFEELGPVWLAALGPLLSRASESQDPGAFYAAIQKMLATLRDGRASIAGPGAPPDFVPPVVWTVAEDRIVAVAAQPPADLKPGDALVSVDGRPAAEVLAERSALMSGSTPQSIRAKALPGLLARASGARVQIEIEPASQPGTRRTVTLESAVRAADLHPPRPEKIAQPEPGIFYIDLTRITDADFNAALPSLSQARGLVFDLRGEPDRQLQYFPLLGRLLNRPVQGPLMAIPIVTRPDGEENIFQNMQLMASPIPPYCNAKKAFLSDGRSAGASETILLMVNQHKLGAIVGEASAGADGTLDSFSLPGGYEIVFTGERVLDYDGAPLFGAGVRPAIAVSPTRAAIAAGRDEVLERAIQAVK